MLTGLAAQPQLHAVAVVHSHPHQWGFDVTAVEPPADQLEEYSRIFELLTSRPVSSEVCTSALQMSTGLSPLPRGRRRRAKDRWMKDSVRELVGELCWISALHVVHPDEMTEAYFERPWIVKARKGRQSHHRCAHQPIVHIFEGMHRVIHGVNPLVL